MNYNFNSLRLSGKNLNSSKCTDYKWLPCRFSYLLAAMLLFLITGCGGGSDTMGPDPGPGPDPDPDRLVSFSEDIQPIFNGSCAVSGCHDSGTQQNGVDLSSYSAAINSVGVQYGTEVIEPEEPQNSPIVDKISSSNPEFGQQMPLNRSLLSQAEIDSIAAWIEDGAPNN